MSIASALPPASGLDPKPAAADPGNARTPADASFALLLAAAGDAGVPADDPAGRADARDVVSMTADAPVTDATLALIVAAPLPANAVASAPGNPSATAGTGIAGGDADPTGRLMLATIGTSACAPDVRPGRAASDNGAPAFPLAAKAAGAPDAVDVATTEASAANAPHHRATLPPSPGQAPVLREASDAKAATTDAQPAAIDGPASPAVVTLHGATRSEHAAMTPVRIETPVGAPGWGQELAQKLAPVVLLHNERAELQLNPAHLGPVEVKISFAAEGPSLVISAADAGTRSALEQSLPQLRDLLAAQGITLGQATVQGDTRQPPQPFAPAAAARPDAVVTEPAPPRVAVRIERLVDVFV